MDLGLKHILKQTGAHTHTHKKFKYMLFTTNKNIIIQNNLMTMIKQILTYRNQEYNITAAK